MKILVPAIAAVLKKTVRSAFADLKKALVLSRPDEDLERDLHLLILVEDTGVSWTEAAQALEGQVREREDHNVIDLTDGQDTESEKEQNSR